MKYFHMKMFSYVLQKWYWFRAVNLLKCQKKNNIFGMRNTQYRIELIVYKQPSACNTTYTLQCRVNCPIVCETDVHCCIV